MDTPSPPRANIKMATTTIKQTMTASEKVFNTVELLDNILARVLLKHVILLQSVSKTFYNHIRGNTTIAQMLHFKPIHNGVAGPVFLIFNQFTPDGLEWVPGSAGIFRRVLGQMNHFEGRNFATHKWVLEIHVHIEYEVAHKTIASWGQILVSQPPICEATITSLDMDGYEEDMVLACDSWITLGLIIQTAKEVFDEKERQNPLRLVHFIGKVGIDQDNDSDLE